MNFRPHEGVLKTLLDEPYKVQVMAIGMSSPARIPLLPPLKMLVFGHECALTFDRSYTKELLYRTEESRGL